jgi:membrane protein implicated in regulation of membrane protease activity
MLVAAAATAAGIGVLKALRLGPHARGQKTGRNLDVGQAVEVVERRPDGSLRVNYRGSQWDAQLEGEPYVAGPLYIRDTRGSMLILATSKP